MPLPIERMVRPKCGETTPARRPDALHELLHLFAKTEIAEPRFDRLPRGRKRLL